MELKILESKKDFIKIELVGEDITLANVLRKELWNDPHVKVSGYDMGHPLIGNPVLIVETDGKIDPKKALLGAVDRIKKEKKNLVDQLKVQLKSKK